MAAFYEFETVDVFTTGTVGQPGDRTFYLQARKGRNRVAVKCEKQQVAAIVQYLNRALNDLPPADDKPLGGTLDLATPVEDVFVLGQIGLGYDRSADRLVVQLDEADLAVEGDDEPVEPAEPAEGQIRLFITRGQAAAFCEHAVRVVESGRPDCQWCGLPIDPDGHPCPRMN